MKSNHLKWIKVRSPYHYYIKGYDVEHLGVEMNTNGNQSWALFSSKRNNITASNWTTINGKRKYNLSGAENNSDLENDSNVQNIYKALNDDLVSKRHVPQGEGPVIMLDTIGTRISGGNQIGRSLNIDPVVEQQLSKEIKYIENLVNADQNFFPEMEHKLAYDYLNHTFTNDKNILNSKKHEYKAATAVTKLINIFPSKYPNSAFQYTHQVDSTKYILNEKIMIQRIDKHFPDIIQEIIQRPQAYSEISKVLPQYQRNEFDPSQTKIPLEKFKDPQYLKSMQDWVNEINNDAFSDKYSPQFEKLEILRYDEKDKLLIFKGTRSENKKNYNLELGFTSNLGKDAEKKSADIQISKEKNLNGMIMCKENSDNTVDTSTLKKGIQCLYVNGGRSIEIDHGKDDKEVEIAISIDPDFDMSKQAPKNKPPKPGIGVG